MDAEGPGASGDSEEAEDGAEGKDPIAAAASQLSTLDFGSLKRSLQASVSAKEREPVEAGLKAK